VPLVDGLLELFVRVVRRLVLVFRGRLGADETEKTSADDFLIKELLVLVPFVQIRENVVDEAACERKS
jgi:hypothetical protein